MAYTKQTWKNYPDTTTPLSAARLNHIEDGISNAASDVSDLEALTTTGRLSEDELSAAYGRVDVDLSGGNVTLTTAPRVAHLTGAAAACTVIFPAGAVSCLVDNDTDYPVTITRSGKSAVVSAGATLEITGA